MNPGPGVARVLRALRPARLAAAFLLAAFALLLAPSGAFAQSAEDLWLEHVGSDSTPPRIESVVRTRNGPPTSFSTLGFHVTFTEPVLADPGDFDVPGLSGEWFRVELNIGPHYDEQDRLMDAGDPFYKPCSYDDDRVWWYGFELRDRLDRECWRRQDMSRHWFVLVGGGNTQSANYAEVKLVPHANHDLADAHGNRLDPTLPTGNAYQGYVFDSRGPNPRLSADVVTHDGFTPVTVTVNFGEPVNGFRSNDLNVGGATVTGFTGADGASVYTVQLTPTGGRRITVRVPRGVATDRDGLVNDPSNPGSLWIEHDPIGVTVTPRELTVPEGGSATYSIVLEAQPLQSVTINVATVAGGDGDVALSVSGSTSTSHSLIFTRSNWATAQTVTIAAAEDNDCSRGRTRFSHTSSSGDPVYNGIDLPQVTAWEGDNDPDCTAPTVRSIERHDGSQAQGQYTSANSLKFRVTFSENVTGVDTSDFSVSGTTATATGITGSGARYIVTVSGGNLNGFDGTVDLSIASGHGITDQAQNVARTPLVNALANTTPTFANQTYTVDNTAPTAVLARADGGSGTLSGAFDVRVTFTEANGLQTSGPGAFTSGDLSVTNGSVTRLRGGPLVWTATVTPNQNVMGAVTVDLPANAVRDRAGLGNAAATQLSVPVDNSPASVASIERHSNTPSRGSDGHTNSDTLAFALTFSEPVTGVDGTDFAATAGGNPAATVSGSGFSWLVTLSGGNLANFDGVVGLTLAANHGIVDAGGNALSSTAPTGTVQTYTVDNTAPTVALTRADGATTTLNGAFDVTVTFTEANSLEHDPAAAGAFTASDFTVANGSVTSLTGTGLVRTASIAPDAGVEGNVLVDLPANAVRDLAGNGNTAAARLTVPVDNAAPTVMSIARDNGAGADPGANTNADSVRFRVTFSESVTNVHAADFDASGAGDATNVTGSGDTWTVTVSGSGLDSHNGSVGLTFAGTQDIADANGNGLDATLPTGTNYQTYTLDNTAPTVMSVERHDGASAQDEVTSADTLTFRVTFSEAVENVNAADFNASGTTGDASTVTPVAGNDAQYIVTVGGGNLATFNGAVGLTFAGGQNIDDAVGNRLANTTPTGANETYTLDNAAPRATSIARDDGAGVDPGQRTKADSLQFRVTFSKAVVNVDAADFDASGAGDATAVAAVTGNAAQYVVTVSGSGLATHNGAVGLTLAAGQNIADTLGNALNATLPTGASYERYTLDNTAPTVTSIERHDGTDAQDERTRADTLKFRVTFSEAVKNVTSADFGASGAGDASNVEAVTNNAAQYIVTVSGSGLADHNGAVGLTFASGQDIDDVAGNDLNATLPTGTNYETYTVDNTGPMLTHIERHNGTNALPRATTSDTLTFRVTFNAPVTNVDTADFIPTAPGGGTATTATATAVNPDSDMRMFVVTLGGGNLDRYAGTVGLGLASGQNVTDAVGNPLDTTTVAGAQNEAYDVNLAGPAPALSSDSTAHEGSSGIIFVDIDFGTAVYGFLISEVTVRDGTRGTNFLLGDDGASRFTVQINPTGTADVVVSVAAGVAMDAQTGGNLTLASNTLTIPYRAPIGAITPPAAQSYTVGTAIMPLTLPVGTGGAGAGSYTYSLTGPDGGPLPGGLSFAPMTRILSGTPTAPGNTVLTYRIVDTAGASAEAFFTVAVAGAAPSGTTPTLTIEDIALTEGQSGNFDVMLSQAVTGGFTVAVGPVGSLAAGYLITTPTLTFTGTAGETQQFTVFTADNTTADGDVTATLNFTASGDAGGVVDDSDTALLTVKDDETAAADTTLSAFGLTAGGTAVTLVPTFASGTAHYTASVANDVSTVTVTATAAASGATVALTPADADTNTNGHQVALSEGANTIRAVVTNTGDTGSHSIVVTRAASAADTTLSALSLAEADGTPVTLTPVFASDTNSYTAAVNNEDDTVTVGGTATDTNATVAYTPAADADTNAAGHQVSLTEGENTITATVTSGSATGTYTITVTRIARATPPPSALVSNLGQVADGTGSFQSFDHAQPFTTGNNAAGYTLTGVHLALDRATGSVGFITASIWSTTNAGLPDTNLGTLTNPSTFSGGVAQYTTTGIDLEASTTYLAVFVTTGVVPGLPRVGNTSSDAEDAGAASGWSIGNNSLYRTALSPTDPWQTFQHQKRLAITGTAKSPPDTTLSALSLAEADGTAVTLTPTFAADTAAYTASVENDVDTVTVSATATDSNATVEITPADADTNSAGHQVSLTGDMTETVTATVTNGTATQDYTIDVTRAAAEVIWSAMLTVGLATGGQANDGDAGFRTGTSNANIGGVDDSAFDVPGVSPTVEATVSRLDWTVASGTLTLELTLPAAFTGYENWTLHVDDDQAALAGVTPSTLSGGRFGFEFSAFFSGTPADSGMLEVCITSGNADCAGGTAATEPIWSATLTVANTTGTLYGYDSSAGTNDDISSDTFTPPGGAPTELSDLEWETSGTNAGDVHFVTRPALPSSYTGWTLHVGNDQASLGDFTESTFAGGATYTYDSSTESAFFSGTPPTTGTPTVCFTADGSGCGASGASGPSGTQAPSDGLQARFGPALAWHTGMAFWTELHFSGEPRLGYRDVRDKIFEVTGADIARALRLTQGSNAQWRLLVEPDGWGDIEIVLPTTTDCAAEGAVCTREGAPLEQGIYLSVPGPGDNLAARLSGHDTRHTGQAFELLLWFNRQPNLGYRDVRDRVFDVDGGRIRRARRLVQGSNLGWRLRVEPDGAGAVTLDLPPTEDCADLAAVCTRDGDRLEQGIAVTVEGPTAFSVSDAEAAEEPGATLAFKVSLSRPLDAEVRVDAATRDGTATAGADYEALAQTLVFAPGETLKTVEVTVLDDAHDEGTETLTLVLSNATGAQIADAEGTGSIANSDAIPKAWLARFGRTVTGQVLDAVEDRLAAPRQASMRATLAGQALPLAADEVANDLDAAAQRAALRTLAARTGATDPSGAPTDFIDADAPLHLRGRTLSGQDVLTGTAFTLTGPAGPGDDAYVSLWGRAMVSGFHGNDDGLALDGRVTTSLLGVDWATEGWTAGLSFGHSTGSGGYRGGDCGADPEACAGAIQASLTGLYPYAGFNLSERLSLWLAAGFGAGQLTVHPHGVGALATDLAMGMGAAGLRSEVLGTATGIRLALKGDARFTRTWSEAVSGPHGNLAAADADVWLVRAGIEGSRRFRLGAATSLIPSLEIGVRRDGGDADAGFGADVGVGLALADAPRGLRLDLRLRTLAAHESDGFRDWGASASLSFDPRPASDRGLSMSLRQAWGASPSGGMEALLRRDTMTGLANSGVAAGGRLEATLSYGVPVFGGALTGAPSAGVGVSEFSRDYRLGWRLTPAAQRAVPFEVNLDATRRESALTPAADHGVMLRGRVQW